MKTMTRRSVLCSSFGLTAAGILARPYVANAAATTVETWWNQGYLPEEDVSFRALVADYQKASGNKIDYSLIPNAPLRQKEISAIQSGGVPDGGDLRQFRQLARRGQEFVERVGLAAGEYREAVNGARDLRLEWPDGGERRREL